MKSVRLRDISLFLLHYRAPITVHGYDIEKNTHTSRRDLKYVITNSKTTHADHSIFRNFLIFTRCRVIRCAYNT